MKEDKNIVKEVTKNPFKKGDTVIFKTDESMQGIFNKKMLREDLIEKSHLVRYANDEYVVFEDDKYDIKYSYNLLELVEPIKPTQKLSFEPAKKLSFEPATLVFDKITTVDGVVTYRLVDFKCANKEDLPAQYLSGVIYFYRNVEYFIWVNDEIGECEYNIVGRLYSESEYLSLIKTLREAGKRLGKIVKEINSQLKVEKFRVTI